MRSGTLRRLISNGTVWALLLLYTGILYPFLWLFVKNGNGGAQSILYSLYTPEFEKINIESMEGKFTLGIPGCNYVINCNIQPKFYKKEFYDVKLQSVLYNNMCKQIEHVEKLAAAKRNSEKQKTKDPTEVKNDENQEEPEFGSVKRGFLNKGKKGGKSNKGKNKKSKW